MEAMLSGVPVISTRLSGIPELVQDEANPDNGRARVAVAVFGVRVHMVLIS